MARMAADAAAMRERSSSARWDGSGGSSIPLSRRGKATVARTRETIMTPAARKMARLRAGMGVPSPRTKGRVRMPARVMAPRTPARDMTATRRSPTRDGAPRPRLRNRVSFSDVQTQMKRRAASAATIAST
ncbi:hypothetical protein D3C81_1335450 [compost metagenome]